MRLLVSHEPQIHYPPHDVRGALDLRTFALHEQAMETLLRHGGQLQADCSEMVTELCRWAGLADPNGLHYARPGFTGTMLAHLPHYTDPAKAAVGALVVFGPGTGDHVCMVLEPDHSKRDPLLFSHGQERGPLKVRLRSEAAAHRHPVTFLSIADL